MLFETSIKLSVNKTFVNNKPFFIKNVKIFSSTYTFRNKVCLCDGIYNDH